MSISVRLRARSAFTLAETMVTLVLIGVLAAVSLPRLNYSAYRADAAARVIRGTLQTAQRLAVTRQFDVIVSFDSAHARVRMVEDVNNDMAYDPRTEHLTWAPLGDGSGFVQPSAGVAGSVAGAITGSNLRVIDGMPSLVFRRDGAASSSLEVYVRATRNGTDEYRAVTLLQPTARADWYRRVGAAWTRADM